MKRLRAMKAFVVSAMMVSALVASTAALARAQSYCDERCNPVYCSFTCCTITWGPLGTVTKMNCFSDGCCAHPAAAARNFRRALEHATAKHLGR
jgi:hypothetical protein